MLPLVQRELRIAARQRALYRNRLLLGIVVVLFGSGVLLFANPNHPAKSGGAFVLFSILALILCLIEGVRRTADAISEEKRAGTLGFLFLTDLRGWDIVLGKFAGAMVRSVNVLLAFVPILSVTLLAGGTTLGDFWRTVLVLVVLLCFSLALCLFVSALSRERSLSAAVAILLALALLPFIASWIVAGAFRLTEWQWIRMISPVALLLQAWESYYLPAPHYYWRAILGFGAASAVFLSLASLILPRVWQEKPRKTKVKRSVRTKRAEARRRSRQLDQNPILWVAYNAGQARGFRILFFSLVAVFAGVKVYVLVNFGGEGVLLDVLALITMALLLHVYIASQSSMNLAEAKRNGALELLLSTPLKVQEILRGQVLALKEMFLVPALVVVAWFLFVALQIAWFDEGTISMFVLVFLLHFVVGICATAAVGMWMGMSSTTPNRALFKTLLIGVLLPNPWFFCGMVPPVIVPLVLAVVAKERVVQKFRRYVAERYLQAPGFILAPVPPADPNTPPVLRQQPPPRQ